MVESDLGAPPESWEVADLDASVRRLMLSASEKESNNSSSSSNNNQSELGDATVAAAESTVDLGSLGADSSDDSVNSVDQFLREALQNPRERLSGKLFFFFLLFIFIRVLVLYLNELFIVFGGRVLLRTHLRFPAVLPLIYCISCLTF